ncbi:MAG: hypothetical protein LBQ30_02555 [Treponema sp.]|nr:hypothetical protein [Treponema sp.]
MGETAEGVDDKTDVPMMATSSNRSGCMVPWYLESEGLLGSTAQAGRV